MRLNIENLIDIIKKTTTNNLGDYTQLSFDNNRIKCSIINQEKNIITKLNIENNVIEDLDEDIELNFISPEVNLIPYLRIFENNIIDLKYTKLRTNIVGVFNLSDGKLKTRISLSEPIISRYFTKSPNNLNEIHSFDIDSAFLSAFDKLKKISAKTDKLYLSSKNKIFSIETGDKSIAYTNEVLIEICKCDAEDFCGLYIFKNIQALISILSKDIKYKASLLSGGKDKHVLYIKSEDGSEEYFALPSKM